ncbi:flagellar basal body protein [uncultured Microbulbifer sp.]|uniref:flagellar basal body rod protein FlgB n=1 Tax=uncultured Microbulbifer sp. TaxID=348147 RepID=UPI00262B869C|nr:flagellar basal body protein [uncultured Microbulbifer sp.]
MIDLINSLTGNLLGKSLDRTTIENRLIANNIANLNTEGYRPLTTEIGQSYVDLQKAIEIKDTERLNEISESWKPNEDVSVHPSYITVSLDQEMVKLANNTLLFQSLATAKSKLSDILKVAIKEGR